MKDIYNMIWSKLNSDVESILDRGFEPNYDQMSLLKEHCNLNEDSTIIDVGCGTGQQSSELYKVFNCNVIAIDPNKELISNIEKEIIKKSGTFENLPVDDNTVDLVFIRESLLHARDLTQSLKEVKRVLKKDGKIYLFGAFVSENLTREEFNEIAIPLDLKWSNMDFSYLNGLLESFGFRIKICLDRVLISSERTGKETIRLCNISKSRNELLNYYSKDELDILEATYKYHIWGNLGKIFQKEMIIETV